MKNTFGHDLAVTIFGESHGPAVGVVLDGLAPGIAVDDSFIRSQLALRRPFGSVSTARREADGFQIVSGVYNGYTTGTPLCIMIPNIDIQSDDYTKNRSLARPGHADYAAYCKYHGYEDYRGGGHFSGRITAAVVAAGAIVISALSKKGILIGTHIKSCGGVVDTEFADIPADIVELNSKQFAVLDDKKGALMRQTIEDAASDGDSVGGVLETAVCGLPAGLGEPWFDTVEGLLAHALFSIPAVKGVQFGAGFDLADSRGSLFNDSFFMEEGQVKTASNNNGGVNGGLTNGMPLLFRCAVKPTPSIAKKQLTVDFINGKDVTVSLSGRHDPAIVHRARVVVDSITALVVGDLLTERFGLDYLGGV